MSSTRYAAPGSPLRQEKFASSYKRGFLANLVAKRCSQIEDPEVRAAIWFAQWQSWMSGGPAGFVQAMRKDLGLSELPKEEMDEHLDCLSSMCLDPGCPLPGGDNGDFASYNNRGTPVFYEDWNCLLEYRRRWASRPWVESRSKPLRRIKEAVEYTRVARCLTVIECESRIEKAFNVEGIINSGAGLVRMVATPSTGDDRTFFRAIAKELGVSSALQMKMGELFEKIEEVCRGGDITLIFSHSEFLCPQRWVRYATPPRLNFLLNELVGNGVPTVLFTTPIFQAALAKHEKLTGWESAQLFEQVGHKEVISSVSDESELCRMVKALLPELDPEDVAALADYARVSRTRLGCVYAIAKRARWLASLDDRSEVSSDDLARVMTERMTAGVDTEATHRPTKKARRDPVATSPLSGRASRAEPLQMPEVREPGLVSL